MNRRKDGRNGEESMKYDERLKSKQDKDSSKKVPIDNRL